MRWLILPILIFVFSQNNCNVSKTNESGRFKPIQSEMDLSNISITCKKYIKKELRKKWKYNETGNCYFESEEIRQMLLDNKDCFQGFNSNQLISILSKPNKIVQTPRSKNKSLVYYLGKECKKYYPYWTMQFLFNENDEFVNLRFGQISYD